MTFFVSVKKHSTLYLTREYIKYWLRAVNAHGVHSPFVFDLVQQVFYDKTEFYCFERLEAERQKLEKERKEINRVDYGAGSRRSTAKRVGEIAKHQLASRKYAQMLFKLANFMGSNQIVELGTSLGLTSAYMGSISSSIKVFTFEGDPEVLSEARGLWTRLDLENIDATLGKFDESLPRKIPTLNPDSSFIYIDGNHTYEATLRYLEMLLPICNEDSVIVFDDIRWSSGMEKAWETIKSDNRFRVTVDLFRMGILFLKQNQEKQNFEVRF